MNKFLRAPALWGGCNWHGRDVTIKVNRYNSFNRTHITHTNWQHNAVHRQGVPYRDPTIAQRYNRNQAADAAQREASRKQAEQRAQAARAQPNGTPSSNVARDGGSQDRPAPRNATDRGNIGPRDRPDLGDNGPGRGGPDRGGSPGRPGKD